MTRAACWGAAYNSVESFREFDPFFPEKDQPRSEGQMRYCINCPVIAECNKYRREIDAQSGVWGGNYFDSKHS